MGTITCSAQGSNSTIDLIFAPKQLVDNLKSCMVYPKDHGSDHKLLLDNFVIETASPTKVPRLIFKEAPWTKICKYLQEQLHKASAAPKDSNFFSYQIVNLFTDAIQKYIPVANPSPYTKRWWIKDLSRLRGK